MIDRKKLDKVKLHGLNWVIVLKFDKKEDAEKFIISEGLKEIPSNSSKSITCKIED